jgi:hypothetical protein
MARWKYLLHIGNCSDIRSFQIWMRFTSNNTVLTMKETTRYDKTARSKSVSYIHSVLNYSSSYICAVSVSQKQSVWKHHS